MVAIPTSCSCRCVGDTTADGGEGSVSRRGVCPRHASNAQWPTLALLDLPSFRGRPRCASGELRRGTANRDLARARLSGVPRPEACRICRWPCSAWYTVHLGGRGSPRERLRWPAYPTLAARTPTTGAVQASVLAAD